MASYLLGTADAAAMTVGRSAQLFASVLHSCLLYLLTPVAAHLQGDDCSTPVDIEDCVIHAESGSPLLFGMSWHAKLNIHTDHASHTFQQRTCAFEPVGISFRRYLSLGGILR